MDYKKTLLLPQTDFAMRANLSELEPKRFAKWLHKNYAYEKMKKKREKAEKSFILHDGPPYANGRIHIGHALNKILKESLVKLHYFKGERVRFTPGWDCHGLPIEQQVEIKLGEKKKNLSKKEIRAFCREHAEEFVNIQREEFKGLGILADWDRPYLTMDFSFEADIYRTLCAVAQKGLLIERSKPVFWSWAAKSALAEAEVEYEEKEDYSTFVCFPLSEAALQRLGVRTARAVIWTTTPWTLVANQAIALNPSEDYVVTKEGLIFAKALLNSMVKKGFSQGEVQKSFRAGELEGLEAINPLNNRKSLFILSDHVLMDGGTGLVHTAPGHGEDDYYACLRYGIEILMPVDDGGCYDESLRTKALLPEHLLSEFIGMHIFKANEKILALLGENLLEASKFRHSYPFCWRTHKPVIYRATKQWFVVMDEKRLGGKSLRKRAKEQILKTRFYPPSGAKRIGSMVENRPDWCISRQRDWGTPIAFFRDKKSGEVLFDEELCEFIASIFERQGADAWWELSVEELLPTHLRARAKDLEKVSDILDVWFDSGSTFNVVLNASKYDAGEGEASVYLEGSDQHRGWFQSSLLISTILQEKAPYKAILTHGFTIDERGRKMSKSLGNVIAPEYVAKTYGVEVLRLWVFLSDYASDLKISDGILKQVSEQYRKIRNTIRFLLANTNDLKDLNCEAFSFIDQWILSRASEVFKHAKAAFYRYDFAKGFGGLLHFLSADLSGIYLDISKDRLYCEREQAPKRKSSQVAMALIAKELLALLAPFLSYTVDEALEHCAACIKGEALDVFDVELGGDFDFDFGIEDGFLLALREKFFEKIDALKKDKIIKSTLELTLSGSVFERWEREEIADWFMVSEVGECGGEKLCEFELEGERISLIKSAKHKCPRCWRHQALSEGELCARCEAVLHA
ncbi:isoleucine--tRNA ligase [Campylobacter sp.]|uniref:isoleucine--tRNA ligase n=1 Tax=Campylobacter sp. TaxID=205 RepID=UPI0026DCB7EF|nr:isoleucine--tRNA ligase [Campylobacter sp.]MDO4674920.1 isoleucine--tRNA ligase [Campylobacter sp.]